MAVNDHILRAGFVDRLKEVLCSEIQLVFHTVCFSIYLSFLDKFRDDIHAGSLHIVIHSQVYQYRTFTTTKIKNLTALSPDMVSFDQIDYILGHATQFP